MKMRTTNTIQDTVKHCELEFKRSAALSLLCSWLNKASQKWTGPFLYQTSNLCLLLYDENIKTPIRWILNLPVCKSRVAFGMLTMQGRPYSRATTAPAQARKKNDPQYLFLNKNGYTPIDENCNGSQNEFALVA